MEVFCVMCGTPLSAERKKKRSITCGEACAKRRKNALRERKEMKRCKYCGQPSTVEERRDFARWRRERNQTNLGTAPQVKNDPRYRVNGGEND
jgi:peptide subunit release factor 1 (eRF1)